MFPRSEPEPNPHPVRDFALRCTSTATGPGAVWLSLTGPLVDATAAVLEDALALEVGRTLLVVDLRGVPAIDRQGLETLVLASARTRGAGRRLLVLPGDDVTHDALRPAVEREELELLVPEIDPPHIDALTNPDPAYRLPPRPARRASPHSDTAGDRSADPAEVLWVADRRDAAARARDTQARDRDTLALARDDRLARRIVREATPVATGTGPVAAGAMLASSTSSGTSCWAS